MVMREELIRTILLTFGLLVAGVSAAALRTPWAGASEQSDLAFERSPEPGVTVRGRLQRTYLRKGSDLVALSVDVSAPPAREPVRLVAPRTDVAKLVSELPAGWQAVPHGTETEDRRERMPFP